eukprot:2712744-Pleurochrysis_carterae.AAC.2
MYGSGTSFSPLQQARCFIRLPTALLVVSAGLARYSASCSSWLLFDILLHYFYTTILNVLYCATILLARGAPLTTFFVSRYISLAIERVDEPRDQRLL